MRPADRFYRVRFADEKVLREWSLRVLEVVAAHEDVPSPGASRQVVFVPLRAQHGAPNYGYVSEGARGLAHGLARGVELEESALSLRELSDGLSLLIGDGVDVAAYERRLPPPAQ